MASTRCFRFIKSNMTKLHTCSPFTLYVVALLVNAAALASVSGASFNFPHCGLCDESKCPELHYCEGKAIKDPCQCCMICSDNSFQPHAAVPLSTPRKKGDAACGQVKCPNLKVCVENVQGLPLCECPGIHMCRESKKKECVCPKGGVCRMSKKKECSCPDGALCLMSKKNECMCPSGDACQVTERAECECPGGGKCRISKKKEICGNDGKTYKSKCHMKIAACNLGVPVRKMYRGSCLPEDTLENETAYRRNLRKIKRRRRMKRRQRRRGETTGKRGGKAGRKKDKRKRRRRKSGSRKNNRNRRHKKSNEKLHEWAWKKHFGVATWN